MSVSPQRPATPPSTHPEGDAPGPGSPPSTHEKGEVLPPTVYPLPGSTEDSGSLKPLLPPPLPSSPLPPVPLPPLPTPSAGGPGNDPDPTLPGSPSGDLAGERRYRTLARIGGGQFGEVFRGESPGGVPVAIKKLLFPLGADQARRELAALERIKNLRHPYLVQLHAYWVEDDRLHIAMELADRTTHERAEECRRQGLPGIPPEELVNYIEQAAAALDYIHNRGLHHRDIKPANLLLLEGYVKVADLGLARAYDPNGMVEASIAGTPCYMPPEVWQGRISHNSDQWSLAVTYAELRLNRRPYTGTSQYALIEQICKGDPDLGGFTERERGVLRKALHRDPGKRFGSCTEFAQALREALQPPKPPPGPGPSWTNRILVVAAVGVLLGVLLFALFRPSPSVEVPGLLVRVDQGGRASFPVRVADRSPFGTPEVEATFKEPVDAEVLLRPRPDEEGAYDVEVRVGPKARPGLHKLVVHAEKGSASAEGAVDVFVMYRPKGFEPDGEGTVEDADGVRWYRRMVRVKDDQTRVPFVVIPKGPSGPVRSTFYIMEDKVNHGLFRRFALLYPDKVSTETEDGKKQWMGEGRPDLPAFNMQVKWANAFAAWLGGTLPTVDQWETAAGRYRKPRDGVGPFLPGWERVRVASVASLCAALATPGEGRLPPVVASLDSWSRSRGIALNGFILNGRRHGFPSPVGTSPLDISPFGCRDMAGNGEEWTADGQDTNKTEFLVHNRDGNPDSYVSVRGRTFKVNHPLTYQDLEAGHVPDPFAFFESQDDIGFRVVIDPSSFPSSP